MSERPNEGVPRGQLREEAAHWFAVMRGPDASGRRAEFEAWLARGAVHREAYNRISEIFGLGKMLKSAHAPPSSRSRHFRGWRSALATLSLIVATGLGATLWIDRDPAGRGVLPPVGDNTGDQRQYQAETAGLYTTQIGEVRRIRLADGSHLILDTDSLVSIAYGPVSRFVRLHRGRARFDVASDMRIFKVQAGNGIVLTRASRFDISLSNRNRVTVQALRGAVEVELLNQDLKSSKAHPVFLAPGDALTWKDGAALSKPAGPARDARWPDGSLDFDKAALADVVAEANRYSTTEIVLGDRDLQTLKVSGTFKINNPATLADRLATLFNLSVTSTSTQQLVLKRSAPQKN